MVGVRGWWGSRGGVKGWWGLGGDRGLGMKG